MKSIAGHVRGLILIAAGGILYVGLNWIPIIGPLLVGLFVGYYGKGSVKAAFDRGIASGLAGSVMVAVILFKANVFQTSGSELALTFMFAWILFVWNVVGMLFCGLGGAAGAMAGSLNDLYKTITGRYNHAKPESGDIAYRICPKCGAGNLERAMFCSSCGSALT